MQLAVDICLTGLRTSDHFTSKANLNVEPEHPNETLEPLADVEFMFTWLPR